MAVKKNNKHRQAIAIAAWLDSAPAGTAALAVHEKAAGSAGEQIYAHDWPSLVTADKRDLAESLIELSEAWADAAGREVGFLARFLDERAQPLSATQWRMSGLEAGESATPYDGTTEGMLRQMQGHVQHLMKQNFDQMRMVVEALREANVFQAQRIRDLEGAVRSVNGVTELRVLQEQAALETTHETIRLEAMMGAAPRLLEAFTKKDPLAMAAAANDMRKAMNGERPAVDQAEPDAAPSERAP